MPIGAPDWAGLGRNLRFGDTLFHHETALVLAGSDVDVLDISGRGMIIGGSMSTTVDEVSLANIRFKLTIDDKEIDYGVMHRFAGVFDYTNPHTGIVYATVYNVHNGYAQLTFTPFVGFAHRFKVNITNNEGAAGCNWQSDLLYNVVDLDQ